MYPNLFSNLRINEIELKNRVVMAPLYLGYASKGGSVSPLLLDHYRLMARSGVAMVVVENATVDYDLGRGSGRTLRADLDDVLDGLGKLASIIKREGALACLQINHGGRFAAVSEAVAPSAVDTFGRRPRAMTKPEIEMVVRKFSEASVRIS